MDSPLPAGAGAGACGTTVTDCTIVGSGVEAEDERAACPDWLTLEIIERDCEDTDCDECRDVDDEGCESVASGSDNDTELEERASEDGMVVYSDVSVLTGRKLSLLVSGSAADAMLGDGVFCVEEEIRMESGSPTMCPAEDVTEVG